MKLNLGLIMDCVKTPFEYAAGEPDGALNLIGICPFVPERSCAKDVLYFAEWSQLCDLRQLPENIISIGGGVDALQMFEKLRINGLIYSGECSQSAIMLEVQETFFKFADMERALLAALLANKPLRTVLNTCAAFQGCHVSLYSSDLSLLGYSEVNLPPDDDVLWKGTLAANRCVLPMIPRERAKTLQTKSKTYPRSTFLNAGGSQDYISVGFEYKDSRVATMIFSKKADALSDHHLWMVDYIADILHTTIVERYNTFLDVHDYLRASMTTALRYSTVMESKFLHTNLARLGWHINDDYQILLVRLPSSDLNVSHFLYDYENIFAGAYSDCVALWFEDFVFILLHNDACASLDKNLPVLKKQLALNNGSCSIGMKFCDFNQMKLQYNLVTIPHRVPALARRRIKYYRDAMEMHIINDLSSCFPLRAICHHAAVRLQEYDIANRTNFLQTLELYLFYNRSLLTASAKMFIHRSTLAYRLKCIEKIVPMDLEDPCERLHILLSCITLRLVNNNALANVDYPGANPRIFAASHPNTYPDLAPETPDRE